MVDVAIIGAGICGCFIAHDLSKYQLSVALIDKADDIACGASMANSAMIHSGHDPKSGTLKARFNVRGNQMYEGICRELGVDFKRTSAFVVATDAQEEQMLYALFAQSKERGIPAILLDREEALEKEPNLSDRVLRALELPTTGIVTPWEVCIALAEEAVMNGTKLLLDHQVCSMERLKDGFFHIRMLTRRPEKIHEFRTADIALDGRRNAADFIGSEDQQVLGEDSLDARIVINAAGVYADEIYRMVSDQVGFTITPKRGEYFVLDHEAIPVVSRIIYPTPTERGKGILVIPTIHNNILLGPSADFIGDKEDVGTTAERLAYIRSEVSKTVKNIPMQKVIRNFAGLRASGSTQDFIVEEARDVPDFINVAAIESPGLSSAPAISEYVLQELLHDKLPWEKKEHYTRRKPFLHLNRLTQEERNEYAAQNPSFGHMVCRCEQVTEGEIVDAIRRPVGARTVKGVKKRTRPGMGRCQGGFCEPLVRDILERELAGLQAQEIADREVRR